MILNASQGKHINRLFAKNAAMAPGSDAFHIHHVVVTFQVNIVTYVNAKNLLLLIGLVSNHNNGVHAIKMSKVNADVGHAAHNKIPLANDRRRLV